MGFCCPGSFPGRTLLWVANGTLVTRQAVLQVQEILPLTLVEGYSFFGLVGFYRGQQVPNPNMEIIDDLRKLSSLSWSQLVREVRRFECV